MTTSLVARLPRTQLFMLILMDIIIAFICAKLSEYFRFSGYSNHYLSIVNIQALLVVVFSFLFDVYGPWRGRSITERLSSVFFAWLLSFITLITLMVMTKTTEDYSRIWLFTWIAMAIPVALFVRFLLYRLLIAFRSRGRNLRHVVIIGKGHNFEAIRKYFSKNNNHGYQLQHVFEYHSNEQVVVELKEYLSHGKKKIDECWLCIPFSENSLLEPVMFALRHSTANIRYMPELQDIPLLNHTIGMVGDFYSMDISVSPMNGSNAVIKRVLDMVIGSIALVMFSPVMVLMAIAVKLTSKGPILFKQLRYGVSGTTVTIYKFRSMNIHNEQQDRVTQATKDDPKSHQNRSIYAANQLR